MVRMAGAATCDYRDAGGFGDGGGERAVESGLHAIGVHGGEQDFAGAEGFAARGPFDGVERFFVSAATRENAPVSRGGAAGVDGEDYGLRAEFVREFGDEFGAADGGGVDGNLVGAGEEDAAGIGHGSDAAADGERDEDLTGGAGDHGGHDVAGVGGGGDVE